MPPSDEATITRAASLANEAVFAIALQCRRLRSTEPEDAEFVMRWWADAQFLVVMLRRLRRTAELAMNVPRARGEVEQALSEFDRNVPAVRKMRDVGEHIDEYALDQGRNKSVSRRALQVGSWDGTTLSWLGDSLNADQALGSAEALVAAIRRARGHVPQQS
jgi:hypothetical protein